MKKINQLFLAIGAVGMILAFQNCSDDMVPLASVVSSQYIQDTQNKVDAEALPRLLNSAEKVYWRKGSTVMTEVTPAFGDVASIVVAIDTTFTGAFRMASGAEEARLSVSAGTVRATHFYDASNYSYIEAKLPENTSTAVVAASFGVTAKDLRLMINGSDLKLTVKTVAAPLDYSYLMKTIAIDSTAGNFYEAAVYMTPLQALDLNVLSRYVASSANIPNVSFDMALWESQKGDDPATNLPSAQFLAAKAIIDTNCLSCHNSSNHGDFTNLTQSQFLQRGYVVAKSPSSSKIYYRLVGATGGIGPRNMPQNGSLTAGQVQTIADWINSIQ